MSYKTQLWRALCGQAKKQGYVSKLEAYIPDSLQKQAAKHGLVVVDKNREEASYLLVPMEVK